MKAQAALGRKRVKMNAIVIDSPTTKETKPEPSKEPAKEPAKEPKEVPTQKVEKELPDPSPKTEDVNP